MQSNNEEPLKKRRPKASLRIVFMGTPEFAVAGLRTLAEQHDIVAVVTAPDKPAGRGKKLSQSAVKEAAIGLSIPVLQPEKLKDPSFQQELQALNADLFVVVAFRMLPESVWAMPPMGTINLHASLLPAYRGAAPINRAIMNGERETGLSTFFIEREIDTGNVIEQVRLRIGPDEDAGSLHDRMMELGASLLQGTVEKIASGKAQSVPQGKLLGKTPAIAIEEKLPEAPKIFREDCRIDWRRTASEVHNHIRGLSPYPTAFTLMADKDGNELSFKIFKSVVLDTAARGAAGSFAVERNTLLVNTADQQIAILELQAPGKRRMKASEFLNGYSFEGEMRFVNP